MKPLVVENRYTTNNENVWTVLRLCPSAEV